MCLVSLALGRLRFGRWGLAHLGLALSANLQAIEFKKFAFLTLILNFWRFFKSSEPGFACTFAENRIQKVCIFDDYFEFLAIF